MMNKWCWLLLVTLCWFAAGFTIFARRQAQTRSAAPLPSRTDRIVSMAPSLTEILYALGLDEEIVAVTIHSDYPPAAAKKPKVGTFRQPNIEAVIAARPDLVITLGFDLQRNLAERLKRLGCNCLTLNIETVEELFEAIEKIGAAAAKKTQADELVSNLRKKLKNLSSMVAAEAKPKVLWVVQRQPLRVAGRDTFVNEMIELAGGENAIGPTIHKYPPIGAEQVYACAPDVIIEPAMLQEDLAAIQDSVFKYWSKFQSVPAVKNERIYVINGDTVSRLGPRLYDGLETIARCLRPELFEN